MPQHHEPGSLKLCCMRKIVGDFELICYGCRNKGEMARLLEDESYLSVAGPFTVMPAVLISEMMSSQSDKKFLGRRHLQHLIQPHITTLNFSAIRDVHICVQFMQERCKNLRVLDMSYQRELGPPILVPMIPYLTEIRSLNLNMTDTIDQVLKLVGDHCPHIQSLDIRSTSITENGLNLLCYDEETNTTRCTNLKKLMIQGCYISSFPVAFFLQKVPSLQELDYPRMFEIFAIFAEQGYGDDSFHLNLTNLTSIKESYINDMVTEYGLALCPSITNVVIDDCPVYNDLVNKLSYLRNLAHLSLTNNEDFTIDFHEGVLPILIERGEKLKSLLLSKFTRLDVGLIGELCPKLENLALCNIIEYDKMYHSKPDHFNHLRKVELWSCPGIDTLSSVILDQLLSYCPRLENLLLSCVNAINDKILLAIWQINPMHKLTRTTLNECTNISPLCLGHLLDLKNNLNFLRVWSCALIQQQHRDYLKKRIKDENMDVYLEWYPFELQMPVDFMY